MNINFYGKKNRVILPITTGNKSDDRNISLDVEDNTFLVLSVTNRSSSESDSSYEEKYEDLSGKEKGVNSEKAVEEDESKKKTTISSVMYEVIRGNFKLLIFLLRENFTHTKSIKSIKTLNK